MPRYYTMVCREPSWSHWAIQFGSYDRDDVKDQISNERGSWPKGTKFKIITTDNARQSTIEKAVAELL